jgi:hypothetical protein
MIESTRKALAMLPLPLRWRWTAIVPLNLVAAGAGLGALKEVRRMAVLDPGTEAEIVAAIDTLHGDRTLVVIAHRLSTVKRCDRIIVMQDGRVTAVAPYGKLLATHHPFQQIAGHATREDAP